jgi:hypothetical protein
MRCRIFWAALVLKSKRDPSAPRPSVQTTHARKNRATPVGMTGFWLAAVEVELIVFSQLIGIYGTKFCRV